MCDLFQANPWKPLLCTNCHQNRSGHQNLDKCDHASRDLPSSTSTMHLYEEIMAQYFTTSVETLPLISNENEIIDNDEDSFSDEEEDVRKTSTIEFIPNQSMINTQGIVLMGPELRSKEIITPKKPKKIHLLKKSKSNADDCLKKTEMSENNASKLWWFKVKKANGSPVVPTEVITESNKANIASPALNTQKIRVLPEMNKLTLNEALNIARRQHSIPTREPKLPPTNKPFRLPMVSNYGSSIASTTSSSTQSSNEYEPTASPNPTIGESTYLTAVSPIDKNLSLITIFAKTNQLTLEHLTSDVRIIIAEYKQNLPVAHFQTFKSFLTQDHLTKRLSTEAIYFLLLQILDEFSHHSIPITTSDHFLITYHSTIPMIVTTTTTSLIRNEEETMEELIQNLAKKFFDSSSLPIFNDLPTFENIAYRYLCNQVLQWSPMDLEKKMSMQRVQLLDLFWHKTPSLRHLQINEENERSIFALYYLMRYISQSDTSI